MYQQILANVALDITLAPEEATCFTCLLRPQQVASGDHLLAAGDRATRLWFVVSGCVRTYTTDGQGREHNLAFPPKAGGALTPPAFLRAAGPR